MEEKSKREETKKKVVDPKKATVITIVVLAFVAVICGLSFFFFARQGIKGSPSSLSVETIEDKQYLVAEYNANYNYKFRLELERDGEFFEIATIVSETNILDMEAQQLTFDFGQNYRFSACYTNGSEDSSFSDYLIWSPSNTLDDVSGLQVEGDTLSWNAVEGADGYIITFVSIYGEEIVQTAEQTTFSLSEIASGRYTVYVVATSTNEYVNSSSDFDAVRIEIEKIHAGIA